jgi:hypothetical protein
MILTKMIGPSCCEFWYITTHCTSRVYPKIGAFCFQYGCSLSHKTDMVTAIFCSSCGQILLNKTEIRPIRKSRMAPGRKQPRSRRKERTFGIHIFYVSTHRMCVEVHVVQVTLLRPWFSFFLTLLQITNTTTQDKCCKSDLFKTLLAEYYKHIQ